MIDDDAADLVNDFVGSAQIFSTVIDELTSQQLRAISENGTTLPQLKLLKLVSKTEPVTITDVAAFMQVSPAAASKGIDKLVQRGLLRRKAARSDRRELRVWLSPDGADLLERQNEVQTNLLRQIFAAVTPDELRETADVLDRLSAEIVDHGETPDELCMRCGLYFRNKCLLRQRLERTCIYHIHRGEDGDGEPSDRAS